MDTATPSAPSTAGVKQDDLVSTTRRYIPNMLLRRKDCMSGVVHIHDDNEKMTRGMIIYGMGYLCNVNFTLPLPPKDYDLFLRADKVNGGVNSWKKHKKFKKNNRKNNKDKGKVTKAADNFRMVDRYRPIYYAVSLGSQEMLVVEKPWIKVLRALPHPVYRKKYGKS